jgi:hypothetical protein
MALAVALAVALAAHRADAIFKKCDRSNHRPNPASALPPPPVSIRVATPSAARMPAPAPLGYNKQDEKSFRDATGRAA